MGFRLLDLPNELIIRVVELVDSVTSISRIACTSKRMQELAEPVLYRRIVINNERRIKALVTAFATRPQRASAVHELGVPANQSLGPKMPALQKLVMQMKNLKNLTIESPLVNNTSGIFESELVWTMMTDLLFEPFESAVLAGGPSYRPLQKLTSLTLHLNGPLSPYWDLDCRSLCVFKHQTLETVHVSCMNLGGDIFLPPKVGRATPLKHLVLEECNITVSGLKGLLALPAGLETLYLGENCYNFSQFPGSAPPTAANMIFATAPEAAIAALKQQSHSLKTLTYATSSIYSSTSLGAHLRVLSKRATLETGGFEDFSALEKVHLTGACLNFENAVLNGRSPPNLRELEIEKWDVLPFEDSTADGLVQWTPFIRVDSPSIPKSLTKLTLVYAISGRIRAERSMKNNTLTLAKAVKERFGLTLELWQQVRGKYIPPYLYGEPRPKDELLYDGGTGLFSAECERSWLMDTYEPMEWRVLRSDMDFEYGDDEYVDDDEDDDDDDDDDYDEPWPVV